MNRDTLKRIVAMVLLVAASCALAAAAQDQTHPAPNILLILVDDVGYADVGAFAARIHQTTPDRLFYETPHIDKLAQEGTLFTQFYACTVCAPTRASLMTGKMNNRMGMWDAYAATRTTFEKTRKPVPVGCHVLNHEPWDEYRYSKTDRGVSVPVAATALHDVKTIPQGLTGYHSAFIGKWHMGSHNHKGYRPEDQGFDETSDIADIYPTLMEIAGVDYADFKADATTDGESLTPLFGDLKNKKQVYTRDAFYQFYGKLGYKGFHDFATWATLRRGDYKVHYDYHGKVELYNIARDMFEENDLVTTEPKLAHDLLVQLTDWLTANCNEAYLPMPNAQFNPHGELPYGPYVPLEQLKARLLNSK